MPGSDADPFAAVSREGQLICLSIRARRFPARELSLAFRHVLR